MAIKHTFEKWDRPGEKTLETRELTAMKAIRFKCLACTAGQRAEVSQCHIKTCPLWPFRFGRNPTGDEMEKD